MASLPEICFALLVTIYQMIGFGVAWLVLQRVERSRLLSMRRDVPMSVLYVEAWPVFLIGLALSSVRAPSSSSQ